MITKLGSSNDRDLLADLLFLNSRINSSAECIDFSITTNLEWKVETQQTAMHSIVKLHLRKE